MILAIDVSKWQSPLPWAEFKAQGFLLGIAKASMGGGYDGNCDAHVASMKEADVKVGLYHWVDPTQDAAGQAQYFLDKIAKHSPDCIAFDVEQWWASWPKYWDYVNGKIPSTQVPRLNSQQLVDSCATVAEIVEATCGLPHDRLMVYTGRWFTNIYPELAEVMSKYRSWPAHYKGNFEVNKRYTWDEFFAAVPSGAPSLPHGVSEWTLWQFTSYPILPPVSFRLDCNVYNGDIDDFNAWLGEVEPPPPLPSDDWWEALKELREQLDDLDDFCGSIDERLQDLVKWKETPLDE